jgi:hypothetical protein
MPAAAPGIEAIIPCSSTLALIWAALLSQTKVTCLIVFLPTWYQLIHGRLDRRWGMQFLLYPHLFVDKYAALSQGLILDSEKPMQAPVKSGMLNETFVDQCLAWLDRFETTKAAA